MQHSPPWHAAAGRAAWRSAGPDAAAMVGYDRLLQRSAMLSMAAAMGAMLCGLPLHLVALGGGTVHGAAGVAGWLSAALATIAIAAALPALRRLEHLPPSLGRGEQTLVLCCTAAAYVAGWAGLLGGIHTLLYFDVAAMSLAAVAEGRALDVDGRRRSLAAAEQLALLTGTRCPAPPVVEQRSVVWPLAAALGVAMALVAARHTTPGAGQAVIAALATAAACCPCAIGRARAVSFALARELAQRDGWIVASGQALAAREPWRAAIALPQADMQRLAALGRAARLAARLNLVWSIMVPALLLPLALGGPVDPLLPAAAMVIAWSAIGLTNRLLLRNAVP